MESWRVIPGYDGKYEVSDQGRVRDAYTGTLRRISSTKFGHLRVSLCGWRLVHQLVLETFVGPRPKGHEACHWDGDPTNNRLANLRWGTRSENISDAWRHGSFLFRRGMKAPNRKLDEKQVAEIRNLAKDGRRQNLIATKFGVSPANISFIVNGKYWANVE